MDRAIKAARLGNEIRDSIAEWTSRDIPGMFFTVTQVTLSVDSTKATVWVESLMPAEEQKLIQKLKKLEKAYSQKMQRTMRRFVIPSITFAIDDRTSLNARFDELLGK